MLRRVGKLAAAVTLTGLAYIAFVVIGMRTGSLRALSVVRRVNRAVFNPIQMKSAGTPGAYAAIIRHRGRRTGVVYETPVGAEPTDDGFVIALPYGTDADWLKNLMAAGSATIVHGGTACEVEQPRVEPLSSDLDRFPPSDQRMLRWFGVENCVRVRRSNTN